MLGLKQPERHGRRYQHEDGAIGMKAAVEIHVGLAEIQAVTRGAAHERELAQDILQGARDRFFAHGQTVDQQKRKAVIRVRVRARFQAFQPLQRFCARD